MKKENNYYGVNIKINSNNVFNNYNLNTDKSLKVKIHDQEYEIQDQNLIQTLISLIMINGGMNNNNKKNTNINANIKKNEHREFSILKKNLFPFPKELDKNTLELLINLLSSHLDENPVICVYIRKLINICIKFQLYDVIKKEVNEYLLPKISKVNCIEIIINFIDLIFQEKIQNYFINLIKKAITIISFYLPEFIINKKESLFLLSNETLEEIVEIYFENKSKFKENYFYKNKNMLLNKGEEERDIKNVLELLMYARNIYNDIFTLLENERKNALKNFEISINEDKEYKPKFIWRIKFCDIKNEIYKEYKICLDNVNLLLVCYYEPNKDIFQLALQIIGININNMDNNNINFKDNNNILNITLSPKKINKEKNLDENNNNDIELNSYNNNNDLDEIETKNYFSNKENKENITYINDIISILYSCELSEIGFKSKINFNCVQHNCKSKFLVFKLDNFSKLIGFSNNSNNNKSFEFSIKFYFSRNYIFSSIINHICTNLDIYHKYFSVYKIPKLALCIILKNYNIVDCSKNEYYKLQLIQNWLKSKNNYNEQNILGLFKLIKWPNLSTDDLVDFFINNAKLLSVIKELKNDLFYEIQRRFQNEYFSFFQNDKILQTNLYNNTESNTESIKFNNIPKIENIENSNSFTFDFLTKLLSYFSTKNIKEVNNELPSKLNHKEINYTTPMQGGRNIYKLVNQRNNNSNFNDIPRPKISKSIRLNESPNYNNVNKNKKEKIKDYQNNYLNKRNTYSNNNSKSNFYNKNSNIFYINNLTNNKKKSSNSSLISNYHNISAKNCEAYEKNRINLIQSSHKKLNLNNNNKSNSRGINNHKKFTSDFMLLANLNGGKSSSLVVNKSSNKIMNKKNHSRSVDKNTYDSSSIQKANMPEKNDIYFLKNYLKYNNNNNENGQKLNNNNNIEKNINGLQKNNYNNNEEKRKNKYNNNSKMTFYGNSHSKAKLIKSFNSPFSANKRYKKNSSENRIINTKVKRCNNC